MTYGIMMSRKTAKQVKDKDSRQTIMRLINIGAMSDITTDNVDEFVVLVEAAAVACNMILRPLDKKSERNTVFHKTNLKSDELAATKDPIDGAVSAGVLLFSRLEGAFLNIPDACEPEQCASLLVALVPSVSVSLGRLLTASAKLLRGAESTADATILSSLQILSKTKRSQLSELEVDGF